MSSALVDLRMGSPPYGKSQPGGAGLVNRKLSALKCHYFIDYFTNGFIACFNFYRIKSLIHRDSCNTSINNISGSNLSYYINL